MNNSQLYNIILQKAKEQNLKEPNSVSILETRRRAVQLIRYLAGEDGKDNSQ